MYRAENYVLATSVAQAEELLLSDPKNSILGGGMWLRLGQARYHTVIDISRLGLDYIREEEKYIELGAMTTLRQMETHPLLRELYGGVLPRCLAPIVGVPFRNTATVGGTVFGQYAFSDILTVLLALDARVLLNRGGEVALASFLALPRGTDILLAVRLPKDGRRAVFETQRLTRTDFGILSLCAAALPNGEWRLSIGNRPARALRCEAAERYLAAGEPELAAQAARELPYASSSRGSAEYRRALAGVFTRRAWETLAQKEVTP